MNKTFIFFAVLVSLVLLTGELPLKNLFIYKGVNVIDTIGMQVCYYSYEIYSAAKGILKSKILKWTLFFMIYVLSALSLLSHLSAYVSVETICRDLLWLLFGELILLHICEVIGKRH